MTARRALAGVVAAMVIGLIVSGCTHGPASSSAVLPRPATATAGPSSAVLPAVAARAADLKQLTVHTVAQDKRSDLVQELMTLSVPVYVQPLATSGRFGSGATLTVAGRVTSPKSPGSKTALIVLRGPGYVGRHQVSVAANGIVAASLTLPQVTAGDWAVAIEDLSQVHLTTEGTEAGYAVIDLADFPVS